MQRMNIVVNHINIIQLMFTFAIRVQEARTVCHPNMADVDQLFQSHTKDRRENGQFE